jgi:hypothetical protein
MGLKEHALTYLNRYYRENIALDGEEVEFEVVEENDNNTARSYMFVFEPAGAPRHHVQFVVEFLYRTRHVEVWHYTLNGEASYRVSDDDLPSESSAVKYGVTMSNCTGVQIGNGNHQTTLDTIRNNVRGHYNRI